MFRPSMLVGLIAGTLAFAAPANGTVLAFAPDDGTDYSAHIILVTGKPLPDQEICETDVQSNCDDATFKFRLFNY